MAGIGPIRQDWEPVVVRKKAPTAAAKKDEKAVNAARRAGAEIDTMKKCKWFHRFWLLPPLTRFWRSFIFRVSIHPFCSTAGFAVR
jgi:hypothetical protein